MRRLPALLASVLVVAACAGAPDLLPGTRACLGFPAEVCARQVAGLDQEGVVHGGVVAYRIVCTAGPCTAAKGDGTQAVLFADGTGGESGFGYATAVETPGPPPSRAPLPVAPACLGVPPGWCTEQARTGVEGIADWSRVVAITVRCTSTCSLASGDGETRVCLRDVPDESVGWFYCGEFLSDTP